MEKTHAGLDDCLNMLLSCFRKRMSDLGLIVLDEVEAQLPRQIGPLGECSHPLRDLLDVDVLVVELRRGRLGGGERPHGAARPQHGERGELAAPHEPLYRVVQLNLTPEIEAFYMLSDRFFLFLV